MKRKYKQWWSTLPPIWTKWTPPTSNHWAQFNQYQQGKQSPLTFSFNTKKHDIWRKSGPWLVTGINKMVGLNLHRFTSTKKDHILSQKQYKHGQYISRVDECLLLTIRKDVFISLFLNEPLRYIGIENYKTIYKYIHVQLQLQRNRNGHRD
jgi:hypothetical protein